MSLAQAHILNWCFKLCYVTWCSGARDWGMLSQLLLLLTVQASVICQKTSVYRHTVLEHFAEAGQDLAGCVESWRVICRCHCREC